MVVAPAVDGLRRSTCAVSCAKLAGGGDRVSETILRLASQWTLDAEQVVIEPERLPFCRVVGVCVLRVKKCVCC